jgi:hypothetical protein
VTSSSRFTLFKEKNMSVNTLFIKRHISFTYGIDVTDDDDVNVSLLFTHCYKQTNISKQDLFFIKT